MYGKTNSISVAGKDYNPANAKQYREHNRNSSWPTIPLPSEIGEETDHIFFLVDLAVPKRFFSLSFTGATFSNITITSKYYKDTALVKSETEPSLTSVNYEKYYATDNDANYLIVEVDAVRGNISQLVVGSSGSYGYHAVDSGILEISGNCNSVKITMNSSNTLLRTLRMEYFSFYGIYAYDSNNLYLGAYYLTGYTFSALKSVPELKFANIVLRIDDMFQLSPELVSIDDTAFNGKKIDEMRYAFRECGNLINCGHINEFTSFPNLGQAFKDCHSLQYLPISKLPHNTSGDSNSDQIYLGCTSITDITDAYSDPENDGITNINSKDIFTATNITELPESYVEGPNQCVSEWFRYCPIVIYRGTLNGTREIKNNEAFRSCQQFRMTNITRSLDIRNDIYNRYNLYTRDELLWIFNNGLTTLSTTQTLTIGATALALLSDEDKAIATNKGWTLA